MATKATCKNHVWRLKGREVICTVCGEPLAVEIPETISTRNGEHEDGYESKSITLSSGISFRLKAISPLFYQDVLKRLTKLYPAPKAPVIITPTVENPKGEEFINEEDPDYKAALAAQNEARGNHLINILILKGLEVTWEDEAWLREDRMLGLIEDESPEALKLYYVRNVAVKNPKDLETLVSIVSRQVTVTEEAVAEATEKFQGDDSQLPN